jgi:hypothetical protein
LLTLNRFGENLTPESVNNRNSKQMNKSNLILIGIVAAGLIVGVALGGYKDASAAVAS